MHWRQVWAYVWVAPITCLSLPLIPLAKLTGGTYWVHTGVIEVCGGAVGSWLARGIPVFGVVNAITIGHLVAGISPQHLVNSRVHERVHVCQFERWGCFFPLVYAAAGLKAHWQGKHFYWDNPYEIAARQAVLMTCSQPTTQSTPTR